MKKLTNSQKHNGFAMVAALVIMTAAFIMAGSLATTRQMWGFFSTKQLDRGSIEMPARADAANWIIANRDALFRNKVITNNIYLAPPTGVAQASISATPTGPAEFMTTEYSYTPGSQPFPVVVPYPEYDTNGIFGLNMDYLWNPAGRSTELFLNTPQGAYDPYFGITNTGFRFWTLFRREMDENVSLTRVGRTNPDTTQLRAWASIDSALLVYASYRRFPLSAFTLYLVPETPSATPLISRIDNLINPLTTNINHNGLIVSNVAMGRIYVDGRVNFERNPINLGLPLVSTYGDHNRGIVNLSFPNYLGGGTTNLTIPFQQSRYLEARGMIAIPYERPQRLISMNLITNSPFYSKSITNIISEAYGDSLSPVTVKLELNRDDPTNRVVLYQYNGGFNGADVNQANRIRSTNVWVVDHTNRVVTFSPPPGFFDATNFSTPPTSIFFRFTGTNSTPYKLRLNVPSVGALSSDPARQKLSIISTNTLVVATNGFNANNSGTGSMLVSPNIEIAGTSGSVVNIGGVIFTRALNDEITTSTLRPETPNASITVNLRGSLLLTRLNPTSGPNSVRLLVTPDVNYLTSINIPPLVMSAMDFRISEESVKTYTIFANTNSMVIY
jgi:hypothetical protein